MGRKVNSCLLWPLLTHSSWGITTPAERWLMRSMRLKPPVSRFCAWGSKAIVPSRLSLHTAMAFSYSRGAAMCSCVLTLIWWRMSGTVADTVCVPIS